MQYFKYSMIILVAGLIGAFLWGGVAGLIIAAILSVMEVSLSFDNAVVNASVLKQMDEKWQKRFLIWGILIAVVGMRLIFPVLIVSAITGLGMLEVSNMALTNANEYSKHLIASHVQIAAFGGTFLMLVCLSFLLDDGKELHWLASIEGKLARIGKLDSGEIIITLALLLLVQSFLPAQEKIHALVPGIAGIILFVLVSGISALFEDEVEGEIVTKTVKRSGVMAFLYLEVLDASFSFDGVIGAFAISEDVVIIMIGLAIGAMFVRSLTVFLVKKGTLEEYIYLEHGAHYAIGALAILMLSSMIVHISELVTGLIGVAFIGLSLISSVLYNRLLVKTVD